MESSTFYKFPPSEDRLDGHHPTKFCIALIKLFGVSLALFGMILLIIFKFPNEGFNKSTDQFIEGRIFENQSLIDNSNESETITKHFENSSNLPQKNKNCARSPFDEEFIRTLSSDELIIVEQLKNKVSSGLTTTFCEMSSEFSIVRWLTTKNWDIEETEQAILKNLRWREEYRVDELFTENFKYFEEALLMYTDGLDYSGRLVITIDVSSVDLRKIMLAGKGKKLLRYLTRNAEFAMKHVREMQLKGRNITQSLLIVNIQEFNMEIHGCDQCVAYMHKFLYILEVHYPGTFYKIFIINAPSEFELILNAIRIMSPSDFFEAFEVYGTNKQEWLEVILKLIPADQIRPHFGGTKEMDYD